MKWLHLLVSIGSFLAITFCMYFVLDEYYFKHTTYPIMKYVLHVCLVIGFYKLDSVILKHSPTTSSENTNDSK